MLLHALQVFLSISSLAAFARPSSKVVYGLDDRHEIWQEPDSRVRELARSTATLIHTAAIVQSTTQGVQLLKKSFGESRHLCADEPFSDQPLDGFCSAFLVAPDQVVTAGHCADAARCAGLKVVFDFAYKSANEDPTNVPASNIYSCQRILRHMESNGPDFAVIQLDRPVTDRVPLALSSTSSVSIGSSLFVIGSPMGLPLKVAGGGIVRAVNDRNILASLDTFEGISGSPVFDSQTLEVVGLLVRGELDMIFKDGCFRTFVCAQDQCRGEDVTPIAQVFKAVGY